MVMVMVWYTMKKKKKERKREDFNCVSKESIYIKVNYKST